MWIHSPTNGRVTTARECFIGCSRQNIRMPDHCILCAEVDKNDGQAKRVPRVVLVSDWAVKRAASKRAPDENVDDRGSRLNERAQSQEKLYSLLAILGYHAVVGDSWARLLIRARATTCLPNSFAWRRWTVLSGTYDRKQHEVRTSLVLIKIHQSVVYHTHEMCPIRRTETPPYGHQA